jgi:hypothetical protein
MLRATCKEKEQRISELEAIICTLKEENKVFKEKEGGFQEVFARSLVRMRSDQAKRIEAEKELRDMQLKVTHCSFSSVHVCHHKYNQCAFFLTFLFCRKQLSFIWLKTSVRTAGSA